MNCHQITRHEAGKPRKSDETCGHSLRHAVALALMAALVFVLGCGNSEYWHVDTSPIEGTIRINGQPAEGALVTLYPTGDAVDIRESKPWGIADESGVYQLRTYTKGDGAPPGEYRATVVWREDPSVQGSPDQLDGAYENPAQSEWTFTIKDGQEELPAIEITDAKLRKRSKPAARSRARGDTPFESPTAP